MTALAALIANRIVRMGPITVADYMAECLMHPTLGYYSTRDPLGAAGDFTTAPEISQMFGELVGLCLAQAWIDQGAPDDIVMAELGPGRGTLMADALRATRGVPGFHAALTVHFVETSPALRAKQAEAVPDAIWHDRIDTLAQRPLFLIANEFFDALPIRQFSRDANGWAEHVVGVDGAQLALGKAPPAPLDSLDHRLDDTAAGDIVEVCPALTGIAANIGERIAAHGGAALIIDYGDWVSLGDTLQAIKNHAPVTPLTDPGEVDLTAHVDFEAIAAAMPKGAAHTRVTGQGVFLERLGITARAEALAKGLTGTALEAHISGHRRLCHPDEMGQLFKVIGVYPQGSAPPAGLEP